MSRRDEWAFAAFVADKTKLRPSEVATLVRMQFHGMSQTDFVEHSLMAGDLYWAWYVGCRALSSTSVRARNGGVMARDQ